MAECDSRFYAKTETVFIPKVCIICHPLLKYSHGVPLSHGLCRYHFLTECESNGILRGLEGLELWVRRMFR